MQITVKGFEEFLPKFCDLETTKDEKNWTQENPLWGHCAIASAVAQNLFGGKLLRASLAHVSGFGPRDSHYINLLPDGTKKDFSASQFCENYPQNLEWQERTREYVLFGPEDARPEVRAVFDDTRTRYKLLAWRFARLLTDNNPLFGDKIYRRCFNAALESRCQKMWFGCVIVRDVADDDYEVAYEGCNQTIGPLKSLCEPECIRFKIQSRTESMLGACGHAEEFAIWEMVKRGVPLRTCELYVAGFHTNGMPWFKNAPEHTCLRCAVQMYNAGIRKIYVPVVDRWVGITPEEALETARAYATQEKKV